MKGTAGRDTARMESTPDIIVPGCFSSGFLRCVHQRSRSASHNTQQTMEVRVRFLSLLILLFSSCAHSPPSIEPADFDFEISFRARSGAELPVPIVHLEFEGRPLSLLIDTGSTHHALTASAASRFGLDPSGPTASGSVHGGEKVRVRALGARMVSMGSRDVLLEEVLMIDAPAVFEELGIDGVLSPQRLVGGGTLRLNFPERRASFVSFGQVGDGSMSSRPHIQASFDNHPRVLVLVDTGGSRTEYGGFGVGVSGHTDGGIAINGSRHAARALVGRRVEVGGASFEGVTVLAVDASKAYESGDVLGLVGMDILRHCIVSLAPGSVGVSCIKKETSGER